MVSIVLCISILLSFSSFFVYAEDNTSFVKKYLSVKRVNDNYEETVEVITDGKAVFINVEDLVDIAGFESCEINADTKLNSIKLFEKSLESDTSKSFYTITIIPETNEVLSTMHGNTAFEGARYFDENAYLDIIEICNYLRIKICVVADQLLVNIPTYTFRDFLINDYKKLLNDTVSQTDLLENDESLEGSSWGDALDLACNNFDLKFLVPYFGAKELKTEQYEKAILTLSEEDTAFYTENTDTVLKGGLSDRGVTKVLATGKDLANVMSVGGATIESYEQALEMLEKSGKIDSSECAKYMECINWNGKTYDSITQMRALSKYGKGLSDALSIADIIVSGYETLADAQAWSEESLEDLEVLSNLDYEAYTMESSSAFREFFRKIFKINKAKSVIKTIRKTADKCYDDSKNQAAAVTEEVFEKSTEKIFEETITKVHPIGLVVDVFVLAVNTGVSVAKCFGTVEEDLEKGELSYMVSCLINIAVATRIDAEIKFDGIGDKHCITNSSKMNDLRKSLNVYIKSNLRCWSYIYYLKSDGSWENSDEGKSVKEKIDNMNMYLTLLSHTKQYDYALDDSDINTLKHSEIEPILKDESPSKFKSGDYLIEIDGRIICAKSDGIYYKESITGKENKIVSADNVTSLLSDGQVIYYVTYEKTISGTERFDMPHSIYSVGIDGSDLKEIYISDNSIILLNCHNEYLYYYNATSYGEGTLNKVSINTFQNIDLGSEVIRENRDNSVDYMGRLGDKLYFLNKNYSGVRNKDSIVSYDLDTENTVVELNNLTLWFRSSVQYDNKLYFTGYKVNDNYDNKDCYIYIIDSNNKLSKSMKLPNDLEIQIMDSNCEYVICFNDEQSDANTMFDMYRVDLKTGEVITSKGEAGRYKNKNYFVTYDLTNPEDIYFMYNVGLYDKTTNKIVNKKCDDFEINITKPMWIINGYVVDWNLNTYRIYDEANDTTKPEEERLDYNENDGKVYSSNVIQEYENEVYYCSSDGSPEYMGLPKLDFSETDLGYTKLPVAVDGGIQSFIIYNDYVYYIGGYENKSNSQGVYASGTLYRCDLDGDNIKLISSEVTNLCFQITNNILYYNTGNKLNEFDYNSYDLKTERITTVNNYESVGNWWLGWLFRFDAYSGQYTEFDGGHYYYDPSGKVETINGEHANVYYYRKDIQTGDVVRVGYSYSQTI